MNKKHRVLLCDDQDNVRSRVREILEPQADIEVVGEVSGGQAVIDAALQLLPDLVLMDVSMPDFEASEASRQIVTQAPAIKVLAYSMHADWGAVDQMFAAGARGFVLKQGDAEELVCAIRAVLDDGSFLSAGLMRCKTPVEERW